MFVFYVYLLFYQRSVLHYIKLEPEAEAINAIASIVVAAKGCVVTAVVVTASPTNARIVAIARVLCRPFHSIS